VINRFQFSGGLASQRGLPSAPGKPRFIGLQAHTGRVLFRRVEWRPL
jgi:hypothetical protein